MLSLTDVTNPFSPITAGTFADCLAARIYLADRGLTVVSFTEDEDVRGSYDIAAARGVDLRLYTLEPVTRTA